MQKRMPLETYKGVIVPTVTPLTKDGKIDERYASKLINVLLDAGTIPFILGTTGESVSIPIKNKEVFIEILLANKRVGVPAITGLLGMSINETIDTANKYFKQGLDAVVLTLPSFYELSDEQIYLYYKKLADSFNGDIMLYNIPKTVHQSIPLEIIDRLSTFDNIIGIKDSELNRERMVQSANMWKDREDFYYITGTNPLMLEAMELGSKGIVPSSANLIPEVYVELFNGCLNKETERAKELFEITIECGKVYQGERTLGQSLAALKQLMTEIDLCTPYMMPPLTETDAEEKERLSVELKKILEATV